jgi:transposase
MQAVTIIGLDIAKSAFQVHGVDAASQVLIRRQLKRRAVLAFGAELCEQLRAADRPALRVVAVGWPKDQRRSLNQSGR